MHLSSTFRYYFQSRFLSYFSEWIFLGSRVMVVRFSGGGISPDLAVPSKAGNRAEQESQGPNTLVALPPVGLHRSNRRNQGQSVRVMTFLTVRISSSTDLQSTQVEFQLQALPSSTPSRLLHCNQIRVTIDRAIRHLTFNYQSLLTCVLLHSISANLLSRYKSCHG